MSIINRLVPLLELDINGNKKYYSSIPFQARDNTEFKQYEPIIKSENGISRSFSYKDMKASLSVSSDIQLLNAAERLQDVFFKSPQLFSKAKLTYVSANDMTSKIAELLGTISDQNWERNIFSISIKDSQKLYFKDVPNVIFDEKSFQISQILTDATVQTKIKNFENSSDKTLIKNIISSTFRGRPQNYWKGSRVDIISDSRASDDTNNQTGQFAIVAYSWDATIFFNDYIDTFLMESQVARDVLNNTMRVDATASAGNPYVVDPNNLTFQIIKNSVPQNSDSIGSPVPIIYGAVEKVPVVWAVGSKSTRTNSIGIGDDLYLIASHKCKIGAVPAGIKTDIGSPTNSKTSGFFVYNNYNQAEIIDGLKVEVYWSLEDQRVIDRRVSPGTRDWIPNPFPKFLNGGNNNRNEYVDSLFRRTSPYHLLKNVTTLRGEFCAAMQLRGGEFDWFNTVDPIERRAQYAIRYGLGNSKLYISIEGYMDDLDGFYTGYDSEIAENAEQSMLIKNPADVMKHFIMNYTSVEEDRESINELSFLTSRQMLQGWRFDTCINEIISGQEFIDRLCYQSCSLIFLEDGQFKIKTVIPDKLSPKIFLKDNEHIKKIKFSLTPTEDIFNNFIFFYKYDHVHQRYAATIKRNRTNDQKCRDSYAKYGFERGKNNIEFRDIRDEKTANLLADQLIDFNARQRVILDTDIVYTEEVINAKLEIGDAVIVTTEYAPGGWIEKKCIILETKKQNNGMTAKLLEA